MKLRTKITVVCCIVMIFTILISDVLIWKECRSLMFESEIQTAYSKSSKIFNDFSWFAGNIKGDIGTTEAEYYFKNTKDDYTICLQNGKELYNNTIITSSELHSLKKASKTYMDSDYFQYEFDGRHLLIFYSPPKQNVNLYHICDISEMYQRQNNLLVFMICISAGLLVVGVILILFLLKRIFKPLNKLGEGTKAISDGAYNKRVPVNGNDEISALSEEFNKMASAVEKHTAEIEELAEKRTLFMGSLTHELKTPLTAISGYAQTLKTIDLSDDDRNEALTYIYEEAGRLDRLSKKMMRLLELDRDTKLELQTVKIKDLFEKSAQICLPTAKNKNVTIEIVSCGGTIDADFDLMCDVIVNLIDNAIKASSSGQTVKLYSDESGSMYVEDSGCGISESEISQITEPFYMVDKSRSRKSGGAGLGLALVKLILTHHNMDLEIKSTVNVGTKIRIYNLIK